MKHFINYEQLVSQDKLSWEEIHDLPQHSPVITVRHVGLDYISFIQASLLFKLPTSKEICLNHQVDSFSGHSCTTISKYSLTPNNVDSWYEIFKNSCHNPEIVYSYQFLYT